MTPLIIFQLVFFVLVIVLLRTAANRRKANPSAANLGSSNGQTYYWNYVRRSRSSSGKSELSIDAELPFEFTLTPESKGAKLAQQLCLTGKVRTGNPDFDDMVFIACDEPEFCNRLMNSAELRNMVKDLFAFGVKSVRYSPDEKRLTVAMRNLTPSLSVEIIDSMVKSLMGLKQKMPQAAMIQSHIPEPYLSRAKLFNELAAIMFYLGLALVILTPLSKYRVVNASGLCLTGVKYMLAVLAGWFVLIGLTFNKSSLGYDVLVKFLRRGIIGLAITVIALFYDSNMYLDRTPPVAYTQTVIDKNISYGRHSSVYYHLRIAPWHDGQQAYSMTVDSNSYRSVQVGTDKLRINVHPGRWGYEWIENYQVIRK